MPLVNPLDREQLFRELGDIKGAVDGVNERLDTLNSRTRKLEIKVAVQWMLWFLTGTVLSFFVR